MLCVRQFQAADNGIDSDLNRVSLVAVFSTGSRCFTHILYIKLVCSSLPYHVTFRFVRYRKFCTGNCFSDNSVDDTLFCL